MGSDLATWLMAGSKTSSSYELKMTHTDAALANLVARRFRRWGESGRSTGLVPDLTDQKAVVVESNVELASNERIVQGRGHGAEECQTKSDEARTHESAIDACVGGYVTWCSN